LVFNAATGSPRNCSIAAITAASMVVVLSLAVNHSFMDALLGPGIKRDLGQIAVDFWRKRAL
jgi:hypothetical protein